MKLRKQELETLVAFAENPGGFETPEQFCQDFVDAYEELKSQRELWFAIGEVAGTAIAIGPHYTRTQGVKSLTANVFEKAWVTKGYTPEGWVAHMREIDTPPETMAQTAKAQREADKGFWPKAHAIREGRQTGIIATDIKRLG